MRRNDTVLVMLVLLAALLLLAFGCSSDAQERLEEASGEPAADSDAPEGSWRGGLEEPETLEERFSYAFGYLFTDSYKQDGIEFDPDYFMQGMKEATEGTDGFYSTQETNEILTEYQNNVTAAQEEEQGKASEANLQEAEEFLETNRTREGVTETASGLQYEVVSEGEGETPGEDDVVTVHYTGSLLNGKVFESSYNSGSPAVFPLSSIIPGWKEGLQLMPAGSTYRFFIHPDLAYGQSGAGDMIGPNQLLIFEIELLGIEE